MSDGWLHGHHEVRGLRVFEKSSHDAFAPVTCVAMPHLRPAFVSPVNQGRQRQDKGCEMCYMPRRWEGAPFNQAANVIGVAISCGAKF